MPKSGPNLERDFAPGSGSVLATASVERLKISAFKDITAFVLDQIERSQLMALEVTYVKNANQAHADLKEQRADLVFMSYDDTLSIALQEDHRDIVAVMPVHGGILDLCGEIDIASGKVNIGIDTDTGYARALRAYLKESHSREDYDRLRFSFVGATNIRYEILVNQNSSLDATLLNPPYSFGTGVHRIYKLSDAFGAYQGVVGNTNRKWLANSDNVVKLIKFTDLFYATVQKTKAHPAQGVRELQNYYDISESEAKAAFLRLWESDGLCTSGEFDQRALLATREIFRQDTGVTLEDSDDFTLNAHCIRSK
jgi:hypothetical protein